MPAVSHVLGACILTLLGTNTYAVTPTPAPSSSALPAQGNEIEGMVVMVGSDPGARPVIEAGEPKSQTETCPGPNQDYLRKFGGTVVIAKGGWDQNKITKESCFRLDSFEITQLIKGRTAMIGTLSKAAASNRMVLTTDDGKTMVLEKASSGVKKLTGKKAIMDLVPSDKSTSSTANSGGKTAEPEALWKVVSFMAYPEK